jgi:protein SCO1/2
MNARLMNQKRLWSLFWLVLALTIAGCGAEQTHEFAGAVLPEATPLSDFTLTAAGDTPVSLSDFRGQYVFVYFGYTFCPDFCPTTLAKLARVREGLGDDADRMQVIMVSVDPERDTPEALADYVTRFDPSFVGLSGTTAEIDAAGAPFGLFYQKNEGSAATGYLVDHSTRTYLIDPAGNARIAYPHDAAVEDIVADLRWLIEQES